jgi:hypothetical protein
MVFASVDHYGTYKLPSCGGFGLDLFSFVQISFGHTVEFNCFLNNASLSGQFSQRQAKLEFLKIQNLKRFFSETKQIPFKNAQSNGNSHNEEKSSDTAYTGSSHNANSLSAKFN